MTLDELRADCQETLASLRERRGRDPTKDVVAEGGRAVEGWLVAMYQLLATQLPPAEHQRVLGLVEKLGKPVAKLTVGEWAMIWEKGGLDAAWHTAFGCDQNVNKPNLQRVSALRANAVHAGRPVPVSDNDLDEMFVHVNHFLRRYRLDAPVASGPSAPRTWMRLEPERLAALSAEDQDFLGFFDGAAPSFALARDPRLPVMPIVDELDGLLSTRRGVTIDLLATPTGEGKTTALQQLAVRLAHQPDTRVYWFREGEGDLDPVAARALVAETGRTVFVVDRLDEQASPVYELVRGQAEVLLGSPASLHVVGAARAHRWARAKAAVHGIGAIVTRSQVHAGIGFDLVSAGAIVACWERFGDRGLRALAEVEPGARTAHLHHADFTPLLQEAARHDPDIGIFLTDLDGPAGWQPRWPVVWAVPEDAAHRAAPFGRRLVLR